MNTQLDTDIEPHPQLSGDNILSDDLSYVNLVRGINRVSYGISACDNTSKSDGVVSREELCRIAQDICALSDRLTAARNRNTISINQLITLDNHLNRTAYGYTRLCNGYFMRNPGQKEN